MDPIEKDPAAPPAPAGDPAVKDPEPKQPDPPVAAGQGKSIAGGKVVTMPASQIGRLKQEQRERGKREAMSGLEKQAKELGFSSVEEMTAWTAAQRAQLSQRRAEPRVPAAQAPQRVHDEGAVEDPPAARPAGNGLSNRQRKLAEKLAREREESQRKIQAAQRKALIEARRRREAQRQADEREAEYALREAAMDAGIKGSVNVSYAVYSLREELRGKSEKELDSFDETKWFADLRTKLPHLFGEVTRPTTTGTGASTPATPPAAGAVIAQAAQNGKTDAKKMSKEEFAEYLRRRGLTPPT